MARTNAAAAVVAALAAVPVADGAAAQDVDLGRVEYLASCAQCHGRDAAGEGVIAAFLTVPPPDLTGLAAAHGGTFPAEAVRAIVEGGGPAGVHGTPEMPAWGARLGRDVWLRYGIEVPPADEAAFVRARIDAVVAYLGSIQR